MQHSQPPHIFACNRRHPSGHSTHTHTHAIVFACEIEFYRFPFEFFFFLPFYNFICFQAKRRRRAKMLRWILFSCQWQRQRYAREWSECVRNETDFFFLLSNWIMLQWLNLCASTAASGSSQLNFMLIVICAHNHHHHHRGCGERERKKETRTRAAHTLTDKTQFSGTREMNQTQPFRDSFRVRQPNATKSEKKKM